MASTLAAEEPLQVEYVQHISSYDYSFTIQKATMVSKRSLEYICGILAQISENVLPETIKHRLEEVLSYHEKLGINIPIGR